MCMYICICIYVYVCMYVYIYIWDTVKISVDYFSIREGPVVWPLMRVLRLRWRLGLLHPLISDWIDSISPWCDGCSCYAYIASWRIRKQASGVAVPAEATEAVPDKIWKARFWQPRNNPSRGKLSLTHHVLSPEWFVKNMNFTYVFTV